MHKHWILTADAGLARVFELRGPGTQLTLVRDVENPGGRLRDQELVSDEAGRINKSGRRILSAMDPRTSPHEEQANRFARQLSHLLASAADAGDYERLTLIAPPHFLGLLRKSLTPAVQQRLFKELPSDLVHQDERAIEQFVSEFLQFNESAR